MKQASHQQADQTYAQLREQSRIAVAEELPLRYQESVTFDDITGRAMAQLSRWQTHPDRRVMWSWQQWATRYAALYPKRFELTIWFHSLLCSVSLGRPTWGAGKLRLDMIESSPERTPLSGNTTNLTVAAAQAYARIIGATQIRIMNPINSKVRSHYESLGFIYVGGKNDYCIKDLT
ncbi:hypothetical protein [Alkalimonas sp.]|uniref:hypothetical protein n=1 Tax=Alkalimonas sp. TaxID=1872453 RepID=UPI00263B35B5|nr:hypothetical protein [Alkalimonas sp.]MCC5825461.1 hypothetical protein [Alkalimonas sp.]